MAPAVGLGGTEMPRRVKRAATKEQRAAARAGLGRLREFVVHPRTSARYADAVLRFFAFLKERRWGFPTSFPQLDLQVAEFVEHLWHSGDPKNFAADLLSGLVHYLPVLRRQLNSGWRLFNAWGRAEMPRRAPPLTLHLVYGLGEVCRAAGWRDTMVLLLLGFHTFARTGELFAARRSHFTLSWSSGEGVWALPLSKSGQRQGAKETLPLSDKWLVRLLHGFLASLAPDELLAAASPAKQRERLAQACVALGVSSEYQWYSLRRGGATHAFQQGLDFGQLALRGRWSDLRTVRIYVNDALARLVELQLSEPARIKVLSAARRLRPGLSRP